MKQSTIALRFMDRHYGQWYGNHPYVYHLRQVKDMCATLYGPDDDEMFAAAWLHDIIEDTDVTVGELRAAGLSERVIMAVVSVTKIQGESYNSYLLRVETNRLGHKVKVADTICNLMNSCQDGNLKRIKKYSAQLLALNAMPKEE